MSPRAAWRLESLGFSEVYDYVAGQADWLAFGLPTEGTSANAPRAGHLADPDILTCGLGDELGSVRERVRASGENICVVINDEGIVLGGIRGDDLDGDAGRTVEVVMDSGPVTVRPSESLEEVTRRMQDRKVGRVLVTTSDGRLVGVLNRGDAEFRLAEESAGA